MRIRDREPVVRFRLDDHSLSAKSVCHMFKTCNTCRWRRHDHASLILYVHMISDGEKVGCCSSWQIGILTISGSCSLHYLLWYEEYSPSASRLVDCSLSAMLLLPRLKIQNRKRSHNTRVHCSLPLFDLHRKDVRCLDPRTHILHHSLLTPFLAYQPGFRIHFSTLQSATPMRPSLTPECYLISVSCGASVVPPISQTWNQEPHNSPWAVQVVQLPSCRIFRWPVIVKQHRRLAASSSAFGSDRACNALLSSSLEFLLYS